MIPFGYLPRASWVHGLNPLSKFGWLCAMGLLTFVVPRPGHLIGLLALSLALAWAAGVLGPWFRFMRVAVVPAALVTVINILMSSQHHDRMLFSSYAGANEVLFHYNVGAFTVAVTAHSLQKGVFLGLRWLNLVAPGGVFIYTTKPEDFAASLSALRVPQTISVSVAMAFRLMPLVIEDAQTILAAQRSRGLPWDGGLLRKARAVRALGFPLIACAARRALDMAASMEARAFGSAARRTICFPTTFTRRDSLWLAASAALLVLGLATRFGLT